MLPIWYDIQTQLNLIDRETEIMGSAITEMDNDRNSTIAVRAMALSMQSIYGGFEHIMKTICQEIDGHVPSGDSRHADLVNRMGLNTDRRKRVFSEDTLRDLHAMRGIRHKIVHSYTLFLNPELIFDSAKKTLSLVGRFKSEASRFFDDMRSDMDSFDDELSAGPR